MASSYEDQGMAWIQGEEDLRNRQSSQFPTRAPSAAPNTEQPTQPDYSGWGGFRPEGLDQSKVDAGHDSPKYQIARIQSHFDPRYGVTGDMLQALNQLGLGTFSGEGDKLFVSGQVDPRFEGVTGSDINRGFKTGSGTWNAWGAGFGGPAPSAPTGAPGYTPTTTQYAAGSSANASSGSNSMSGVTVVQRGGDGDPFASIGGGVKLSNGAWVPANHPLALQADAANSTGTSTSTSTTTETEGLNPTDRAHKDDLMGLLSERMRQGEEIDPNNPIIKNQVDLFRGEQDRTRRDYLTNMAEKLSTQGLGNSGRLQNEQRFAQEQAGLQTGQFQAELMGRELTARRDEIKHAIDTMGDLLTEQERQMLQRELAEAENAMQKYGIDKSGEQFFAGLDQKDRQFAAELSQRDRLAASDDAFRYASLGQDQSQFLDRLGFDTSDRQAYWDALRRGRLG